MKIFFTLIGFLASAQFNLAYADDAQFPHRAKYKNIPIMEIEQLHRELGNIYLVDVRSAYEYETLHIKDALHIPLNKEKLPGAVRALRKDETKAVVFYCNGTTCKKSYQAAEIALNAGITRVFAYDAGLETWTKLYPEQSVLLGQSPVKQNEIIDSAQFKKHVLPAAEFEARIGPTALVLDIRDMRQRDVMLFPFKEERAQLDDRQRIAEVVNQAKQANKTLLVYDKVGHQARWFQYYLEKQGLKNYFFLDGGSEGYFEAKFGKSKVQAPERS
ncbi:MAG: sulfurtransferase [Gammaproteobacteria bacterium]|nr:sulfurtransferase [Gammaproteobacteria bacterium]